MDTRALRDRRQLAELFAERGYTKGAEIGVADGRYSLLLCETIPGLELYCVDPWEPYKGNGRGGGTDQHNRNFDLALERLGPYDVRFCRSKSVTAVVGADFHGTYIPDDLDFVYIDGNHDFDYVMLDLILWTPKVREGGVVAGHDYYHFDNSGVIEAVDAYTAAHGIEFALTREKREPSFWWTR